MSCVRPLDLTPDPHGKHLNAVETPRKGPAGVAVSLIKQHDVVSFLEKLAFAGAGRQELCAAPRLRASK